MMMTGWTRIVVTEEAYREMFSFPGRPGARFVDDGQRLPDGRWLVRLQRDTEARLKAAAYPGETYSDTIVRLLAFARGRQ